MKVAKCIHFFFGLFGALLFCIYLSIFELITCLFAFYGPCSVRDAVVHCPDPPFRQATHFSRCHECWQLKAHSRVPLWEWHAKGTCLPHPRSHPIPACKDQLLQRTKAQAPCLNLGQLHEVVQSQRWLLGQLRPLL